jgi:hypothetical protein
MPNLVADHPNYPACDPASDSAAKFSFPSGADFRSRDEPEPTLHHGPPTVVATLSLPNAGDTNLSSVLKLPIDRAAPTE